jgi:hypothetical protein
MPKVRPIFRMPSPLARSWRMRLNSRFDRTSAELGAVRPGARKPSVDPFPNDAALKFCEHAEHLKHGLAGGCRRVEALLMQEQVDALVQALQNSEQIRQRSTEPVYRPCGHHIELFCVYRLQSNGIALASDYIGARNRKRGVAGQQFRWRYASLSAR